MADDRKPVPPRSAQAWQRWEDRWLSEGQWRFVAGEEVWPVEDSEGPTWIPSAGDHPFKGHAFCWRCIAEAQGRPTRLRPHNRQSGTVRWCPPPGDETAIYRVQDVEQAGPVGIADPSRPALAGSEDHRLWWQAGASIVRSEAVDTGTFFYEEPGQPSPVSAVLEALERRDSSVKPAASREWSEHEAFGRAVPSLTSPESIPEDQSKWAAFHTTPPLPAPTADGEDRRSSPDGEA